MYFTKKIAKRQGKAPALAWSERAPELNQWVQDRLIVRTDAYGRYRPQSQVGKVITAKNGSKIKLGQQQTIQKELTYEDLLQHFRATERQHVIGVLPASKDNLCKTGLLDV